MNPYRDVINTVKRVSDGVGKASDPAHIAPLTLISLTPLIFRKSIDLDLEYDKGEILLPRGLRFNDKDLNQPFAFLADAGGQKYIFLCKLKGGDAVATL